MALPYIRTNVTPVHVYRYMYIYCLYFLYINVNYNTTTVQTVLLGRTIEILTSNVYGHHHNWLKTTIWRCLKWLVLWSLDANIWSIILPIVSLSRLWHFVCVGNRLLGNACKAGLAYTDDESSIYSIYLFLFFPLRMYFEYWINQEFKINTVTLIQESIGLGSN